jgi:hypothetical protein
MQGTLDEYDNFGRAHTIARSRFERRPQSTFSTPSFGLIGFILIGDYDWAA